MNWFLAPLVTIVEDTSDPDPNNWIWGYCGPGDSLGNPVLLPGMLCAGPDFINSTILVGVKGAGHPDWTSKTIAAAKAHYNTVKGRQPAAREIR